MSSSKLFPDSPIEYLKGVGPQKAIALKEQLNIRTLGDLIEYFPFRYVDKTIIHRIDEINQEAAYYQLLGKIQSLEEKGFGKSKRLIAIFQDGTGFLELIWFQNYQWIRQKLETGKEFIIYGKLNLNGFQKSMAHPELEEVNPTIPNTKLRFDPVYSSNEKLTAKGLDSKGIRRILFHVFQNLEPLSISENLPDYILRKYQLPARYNCLLTIHFPSNDKDLHLARQRLKFEELFFMQLRMIRAMQLRKSKSTGFKFDLHKSAYLNFLNTRLPFQLTRAQLKVLDELTSDLSTGKQMNRLLQGDVGSGKTIVALLVMLLAGTNGYQACIMAPTEVLANQHFQSIKHLLTDTEFSCALLSSNVKGKERETLFSQLAAGQITILIGTHAVLEDPVKFQNLGLVVIDEQHRFGVEQRAKLWGKSNSFPPHILVMTATPIPRTLAMSLYGDLDVSIIDELPPDRKPIKTLHFTEILRGKLFEFMKEQIRLGRQIYIVFPLIEESEKLDIENLELGYEKLLESFPMPSYQIAVVHGRLRPKDKELEMQRFVQQRAQIMVATTVIEVGVNVPNASIMIIENAERFGLAQLHQLRGRVGRGADQSYCVLMTADRLSPDAKNRIQIMCQTNDGFVIAEEDLKIRGPGNLDGTQQSGLIALKVADIVEDQKILIEARKLAEAILLRDPELQQSVNACLKLQMDPDTSSQNLAIIS